MFKLLSEGDQRVTYVERATVAVADTEIFIYCPDGQYVLSDGRANTSGGDGPELFDAVSSLREACYVPGKGTWFGVKITVGVSGGVTAEYNYDFEPDWKVPVDPVVYVSDQEKFPRGEEFQPDWLKQRLAQGRESFAMRDGT